MQLRAPENPLAGAMFKRILYSSFVDISLPYGPGVNELGFIKNLFSRYGDNLHVVIPRPARGMPPGLESLNLSYSTFSGSSRQVPGWLQTRTYGSFVLRRAIRRFNPDLVVMRSGVMAIPQLLVSMQHRIPYVIKTAGDGSHGGFYRRGLLSRSLKFFDQAIQRRIFLNASCIDVVSAAHSDSLASRYPGIRDRIHVIDNGVDADFFAIEDSRPSKSRLGFESSDIVIGYVGNFPMRRGGREVIDAVAALSAEFEVKGLIVGDSGEAGDCRAYAEARGVAERVVVTGEAAYADVPGLMAALDCGLSILRPQERGASEQKVRQYLASGACVVGTSGSNDFLRGCEFARVIDEHDADSVVAAVTELIRGGHDRLEALGEKARQFAERELTIAARNDSRLRYWAEHIGVAQAAG